MALASAQDAEEVEQDYCYCWPSSLPPPPFLVCMVTPSSLPTYPTIYIPKSHSAFACMTRVFKRARQAKWLRSPRVHQHYCAVSIQASKGEGQVSTAGHYVRQVSPTLVIPTQLPIVPFLSLFLSLASPFHNDS